MGLIERGADHAEHSRCGDSGQRFCRHGVGRSAAQSHPVRARRAARADGDGGYRAGHGGDPRSRRQFPESPRHVPHLHHAQFLGHGDRPLPGRHRRVRQHALCRLRGRRRNRQWQRHPLHRERRRAGRRRRALPGQHAGRGRAPGLGAAGGLQHRRHRQDRPGAGLRPPGSQRRAHHRHRRRHRQSRRHPAVGRARRGAAKSQSAASGAAARRKRQDRRHE